MVCKRSKASKFNREVTLSQLVEGARDATGGLDDSTYSAVRTIWCGIRPIRGVERLADKKITELVSNIFTTDYINVVDLLEATDRTEWKLTYNGVDFNITHMVDVNEAHDVVEIYAVRGGAV